ncbi:hypothetical protein M011DRAFT_456684 [Sporormia fimetaria CBS 119925]|uniref:Uncharacterized protein n=1 Tax=Sporormia fimetaria CBS 119925 TaxID=1340428 RepID=A0A6A6VH66_9PLEO|nr:hypothetical protein M011DRAFT_456684 [Sporormia fimetaria CBS 119925]
MPTKTVERTTTAVDSGGQLTHSLSTLLKAFSERERGPGTESRETPQVLLSTPQNASGSSIMESRPTQHAPGGLSDPGRAHTPTPRPGHTASSTPGGSSTHDSNNVMLPLRMQAAKLSAAGTPEFAHTLTKLHADLADLIPRNSGGAARDVTSVPDTAPAGQSDEVASKGKRRRRQRNSKRNPYVRHQCHKRAPKPPIAEQNAQEAVNGPSKAVDLTGTPSNVATDSPQHSGATTTLDGIQAQDRTVETKPRPDIMSALEAALMADPGAMSGTSKTDVILAATASSQHEHLNEDSSSGEPRTEYGTSPFVTPSKPKPTPLRHENDLSSATNDRMQGPRMPSGPRQAQGRVGPVPLRPFPWDGVAGGTLKAYLAKTRPVAPVEQSMTGYDMRSEVQHSQNQPGGAWPEKRSNKAPAQVGPGIPKGEKQLQDRGASKTVYETVKADQKFGATGPSGGRGDKGKNRMTALDLWDYY